MIFSTTDRPLVLKVRPDCEAFRPGKFESQGRVGNCPAAPVEGSVNDTPHPAQPIEWTLRIGVSMEFVGHGMLGFGHPPAWASYFGVVGIGHPHAFSLMSPVGILDLALGISVLVFPIRSVVFYMALWGLWTALLRPLAGESVWEAVERAGNYGAPFALFLLLEPGDRKETLRRVLLLTTALLLLGHGLLGLVVHKPIYGAQYAAIGLGGANVEAGIGAFECLLAAAVLVRPARKLLFFVVAWKLATEALSPIAGSAVWVFIEHGGSYAAPLALACLPGRYEAGASRLNRGAIA